MLSTIKTSRDVEIMYGVSEYICSCMENAIDIIDTVWPEILAGRYFSGLLKL